MFLPDHDDNKKRNTQAQTQKQNRWECNLSTQIQKYKIQIQIYRAQMIFTWLAWHDGVSLSPGRASSCLDPRSSLAPSPSKIIDWDIDKNIGCKENYRLIDRNIGCKENY